MRRWFSPTARPGHARRRIPTSPGRRFHYFFRRSRAQTTSSVALDLRGRHQLGLFTHVRIAGHLEVINADHTRRSAAGQGRLANLRGRRTSTSFRRWPRSFPYPSQASTAARIFPKSRIGQSEFAQKEHRPRSTRSAGVGAISAQAGVADSRWCRREKSHPQDSRQQ